ncbi:unnamed protein product [Strongylus vulgaris]|uniref:Uncharacterized protein n=1 Tax=Strongylus vulgaris TaxID=40348 RepID=A0A3P7JL23_STRVU|nr:unnamed protein product [Strongylus vulgaris]
MSAGSSSATADFNNDVPDGLCIEAFRDYYENCSPHGKQILDNECQTLLECR